MEKKKEIMERLEINNPFYNCIQDFLDHPDNVKFLTQVTEILSTQKAGNLKHLCQTVQTFWELPKYSEILKLSDENWLATKWAQMAIAQRIQEIINQNPNLKASLSQNGYLDLE